MVATIRSTCHLADKPVDRHFKFIKPETISSISYLIDMPVDRYMKLKTIKWRGSQHEIDCQLRPLSKYDQIADILFLKTHT